MKSKGERTFGLVRGAAAILVAIGVAAILIFITSDQPLEALRYLLLSPLSSQRQIFGIFERMIPFLFTGLAACVMFSANQFNLAAEGCVLLGAMVGGVIGIYAEMPSVLHVVVCILAGAIACGIVMLLPALLNTWLGADVMVSSLMLNYIIQFVCQYFLTNFLADRQQGATMSYPFKTTALIPKIKFETSWGIVIGFVMVVIITLFIYRTRWGYAIRMVGINKQFSKYSGIKVAGVLVLCQVIGGMLSGMGGAVEMLGYYDRIKWRMLPGYGWNGVTISILAKNNPAMVPLAAFFLAYLNKGCLQMAIYTDVPSEMLEVIQAVMFLFFAAEQFLSKYRQKVVVKNTLGELASAPITSKGENA